MNILEHALKHRLKIQVILDHNQIIETTVNPDNTMSVYLNDVEQGLQHSEHVMHLINSDDQYKNWSV